MSKVRILVGTRKGAFILAADGKRQNWNISGPHFAGWELYHVKGWDPVVLCGAMLSLGFCALIASIIPARRAASINPVTALRTD